MCAGMLVHISRHLGKTSNNNKRCNYVSVVCFAKFAFIRFSIYDHYYIITVYILPYFLCSIPPVYCPYLIILWVFPTWYHLLYIYLLLHACAHAMIFNACLWFGFIDTRVLIYARHLAFASQLAGEFWLPWIFKSRSRIVELMDSPSCWPEMCSDSVDLQQTIWSPILSGPPARLSSFPSINSWAPFVLFISVHLFVFSHLRLSVM